MNAMYLDKKLSYSFKCIKHNDNYFESPTIGSMGPIQCCHFSVFFQINMF